MMLQGRRFESLDAMTTAMDEVAGNDSWRTAHEKCEGWYCTERSEDGILDLFFVPPMPYATRHGLNTIPLEGPRGWNYAEHADGTLSVSPSIFISPSATPPGWHGFLEHGKWRTV